jgi:class 3 adenylate cyclase
VRCASAISSEASAVGISVRTGLHAREREQRGDDVSGLAVHIGARIGALVTPASVSRTLRDLLLGSDTEFSDRGVHSLKGVPGDRPVFSAADDAASVPREG